MMKSNYRPVLLNAEPFGFGPAAAIAQIAELLQAQGVPIGYIGQGHSHDLQRSLPYQNRYDTGGLAAAASERVWAKAAKAYPVLVTAMDFAAAAAARKAGMQVVIYDALAWYWPNVPAEVRRADMYLAQDFYGVRERLARELEPSVTTAVVPPIIEPRQRRADSSVVLLNLGGLQNPGWSLQAAADYARIMIQATQAAMPGQEITISTSQAIAEALADPGVTTYSNQQMQQLFSRTRLAIMTPGLGNIYDAAAYNIPTLWLPPANDSQGRQLQLLSEHGSCDAAISWEAIGLAIDLGLPQPEVLGAIASRVAACTSDPAYTVTLQQAMAEGIACLYGQRTSKARRLLREFGSGGTAAIADHIMALSRVKPSKEHQYA